MDSVVPIAIVTILICTFASDAFIVVYRKNRHNGSSQLDLASFDNLPVGVVISDPNLKDNPVVYANSALSMITGYNKM